MTGKQSKIGGMMRTASSTIEATPPNHEQVNSTGNFKVGDCVAIIPGGEPMAVVAIRHGGGFADVAWHSGGDLREACFSVQGLHRSPGKLLFLNDVEEEHDRAVELAEAGATKVPLGSGPAMLVVGVLVGFLLAVARGAV